MSLTIRKSLELKVVVEGSLGQGSKVVRRSSVMVARVSVGRPRVSDQSLNRPSHSAPRRCGILLQDRGGTEVWCQAGLDRSRGSTSMR